MDLKLPDLEGAHAAPVPTVTPSPAYPVREVLGRYQGPGQVARLLFAAPRLAAPQDRLWAYERAITLLKSTRNTTLYRRAFEAASGDAAIVAQLPPLDTAWADAQDKKAATELEELEAELNSYKQNLIRKKIRVRLRLSPPSPPFPPRLLSPLLLPLRLPLPRRPTTRLERSLRRVVT